MIYKLMEKSYIRNYYLFINVTYIIYIYIYKKEITITIFLKSYQNKYLCKKNIFDIKFISHYYIMKFCKNKKSV